MGYVYKADFTANKIVYSKELHKTIPFAIVVKGDERTVTTFDSLFQAKAFSKKNKQANVIMYNKQTKKYLLYETIITENTSVAKELAETPFRKALKEKNKMAINYEAIKISHEYSLQLVPKIKELETYNIWWEVTDIVDAEGLSLIKKGDLELMLGSKGIRLLFDSELQKSNFDEAQKIYLWLDKLNANSNDLDVVKMSRKTNLAKMFRQAIN